MPIVKSCCFVIPLKLGAIILGVIGVFQCLFQVYRTLPYVLDFDAEIKRVMENDPIDVEFALRRKKCKFYYFLIMSQISQHSIHFSGFLFAWYLYNIHCSKLCWINFIDCWCLYSMFKLPFYDIRLVKDFLFKLQNSRPKILPYLFIQGTSCVVLIVLGLFSFNIPCLLITFIEIYWLLCAFGLYQKIMEDVKDTVHVKINTLGLPVFKA